MDAVVKAEAAGLNVLVGVATRSEEGARLKKGTKEHLRQTSWCWVDLDGEWGKVGEQLVTFEAEHGLSPDLVVRSSERGGLHAYFCFDEPLDLRDSEARDWLEDVNRGLVDALGADVAAIDATRVMRVPGTTNRPDEMKKIMTGRGDSACTIERAWDGGGHPREAFARFAERGRELRRASGGISAGGPHAPLTGELSDRVRELLDADEALRHRFDGVPSPGQRDVSDSGTDNSLAWMLANRGVPLEEVAEVLKASRIKRGATAKARDDKLWRTAIRAVEGVEGERRKAADSYARLHFQATGGYLPETVSGDLDTMLNMAPPESLLPFDQSDSHLADAFRRGAWGQGVLYSAQEQRFRAWNGRSWGSEYTGKTLEECFFTMVSGMSQITGFLDCPREQQSWDRYFKKHFNTRGFNQVVPRLKARLETESHEFDAHPWLLNVENGVLDLKTGELRPHNPDLRLTMMAGAEWVEGASSSEFDRFLETSLPDEAARRFVQRVAGLGLIGEMREKQLTFFCGPKDSGKSLLQEILNYVYGSYAYGVPFEFFLRSRGREAEAPSPMLAQLPGKRLVFASEVNPDLRLDVAQIKRLTGRDEMRARSLYGRPFAFRPAFTLLLAANELPQVEWTADAVWERLHVVEFTRPERLDPMLEDTLRARAPSAILWWAFQGLRDWQERGLQVPDCVRVAVRRHRESMDPLKDFLDECCVLDGDAFVQKAELYAKYREFVSPGLPMSDQEFGRRMQAHGFRTTRPSSLAGRPRCWHGVRLASAPRLEGAC